MAYVGPLEIGAIHRPAGLGRKPAQVSMPSPPLREGNPPLRDLLAALPVRHPKVDILLSSSLVRFLVVPSTAEIESPRERQQYAEVLFEREFGLSPGSFVLQVATEKPERSALACAIERETLAHIVDACGGPRSVRSIVPLFVKIFNRARRSLASGPLAVVEPARLTLGVFAESTWAAVASRAYMPEDAQALLNMLSDYTPLLETSRNCYVFDPVNQRDGLISSAWIPHAIGAPNGPFSLAACGLAL